MPQSAQPVTLIATFRAQQGHDSTVLSLISAYGDLVRAEPGNIFFDIYTDRDDSQAFVIIERYENHEAFQQHLDGAAGAEFNSQLGPLIEGDGSKLQFLSIVP